MLYFLKALAAFQLWASLLRPLSRHLVGAVVTNRTIDDSFGDSQTGLLPVYFPTTVGVWKDQGCTDCSINPNVTMVFKNTYTAATYHPSDGSKISITMKFNATAIYVYFILANNAGDGITTNTQCSFFLNSDAPVNFTYASDLTSTAILYNQLVYSSTNLPFATHQLEISTAGVDQNVYVNFDYAIYTHDDSGVLQNLTSTTTGAVAKPTTTATTSTPSPSPTGTEVGAAPAAPVGAIVGGVMGGLALLMLVAFLVFCRRRRRARELLQSKSNPDLMIEVDPPYIPEPYTYPHPYHLGPPPASGSASSLGQGMYSPVAAHAYPASHSASSISGSTNQRPVMSQSPRTLPEKVQPPMPSAFPVLLSGDPVEQEQIRQARQAEIRQRLQAVEQEMGELGRELRDPPVSPPSRSMGVRREADDRDDEIRAMREQMRRMQQEIEGLRENQASEWAQGLTDEPPPGYSPAVRMPSVGSPPSGNR